MRDLCLQDTAPLQPFLHVVFVNVNNIFVLSSTALCNRIHTKGLALEKGESTLDRNTEKYSDTAMIPYYTEMET